MLEICLIIIIWAIDVMPLWANITLTTLLGLRFIIKNIVDIFYAKS